jgi:hypothetical protein
MNKLKPDEIKEKDRLATARLEALAALEAAIEEFNKKLASEFLPLEDAFIKYKDATEQGNIFRDEIKT